MSLNEEKIDNLCDILNDLDDDIVDSKHEYQNLLRELYTYGHDERLAVLIQEEITINRKIFNETKQKIYHILCQIDELIDDY